VPFLGVEKSQPVWYTVKKEVMVVSELRVYEGNEPFAYASFSKKDSARVLPILEQLAQRGVRVWYDQGIAPGTEWVELLAQQMNRSDTVLVFLSAAAAESRFCQNEIHYAEMKKKNIIVIYLEDVNLQPSLQMILARYQVIHAYKYASDADLAEHLSTAFALSECQPIAETETPASMPPQKTNDPTMPYDGDEPYIFISYAHRDDKAVLPIVEELSRNGYRVWYDQGIDPGTEWDENIAQHVEDCGCFIAFLSQNYLDSDNCKDELNYARDLNKERLIVYLEQVRLPGGLAMRINRLQAIFKYTYRSQTDFYNKLFSTPSLGKCGEGTAVPSADPSPPPEKPSRTAVKRGLSFGSMLSAALGFILSVINGILFFAAVDTYNPLVLCFAVCILSSLGMALSVNRLLGAVSCLSVTASLALLQFYWFFEAEFMGTIYATLIAVPFAVFMIRWWIRVLKKSK